MRHNEDGGENVQMRDDGVIKKIENCMKQLQE